jgi:hypothetical protein
MSCLVTLEINLMIVEILKMMIDEYASFAYDLRFDLMICRFFKVRFGS